MRISTKGQVTIPIDVRNKLGLLPDTKVTFTLQDEGVLIQKQVSNRKSTRLLERLSGKSTVHMSTDEIMKLTRS